MADDTKHNHSALYGDTHAHEYNERYAAAIKQLTEDIRAHIDWIGLPEGKQARILDYACGTGLVTHALAPYAGQFVGIDVSPKMVEQYNASVSRHGILASVMRAYHGNLTTDEDDGEFAGADFFGFDLVAVGLGFHHFNNPTLAAKRLPTRLKEGGKLLIIDNFSDDRYGFSAEAVRKLFEEAGVAKDFELLVLDRPLPMGEGKGAWKQRVFMARGTKQ